MGQFFRKRPQPMIPKMTLPEGFQCFKEYLNEVVLFLNEVSWIYDTAVTSLLTCNVLSKIPDEWVEQLLYLPVQDLNVVPTGFIKHDWPSSLIQFSQNCQRLTLPVLASKSPTEELDSDKHWVSEAPREIWRGMNPKKKEEVKTMSAFVHQECERLRIRNIVDLGSGLGYIDRLLLLQGYKILGIESQQKLVAFATQQKANFFPPHIAHNLSYCNLRISCDSKHQMKDTIRQILCNSSLLKYDNVVSEEFVKKQNNNKFNWNKVSSLCRNTEDHSEKVCMIGLHACGDLAVTGMKLYLDLPQVSALILVPCCYHKMALRDCLRNKVEAEFALEEAQFDTDSDSSDQAFDNFPLSEALNRLSPGAKFVCRPFLRLANQGTSSSWHHWTETDHQTHSFSVLSRAVVELFAQQEGASFKKCFRRVVKKTSLKDKDFPSYIDETLSRCQFLGESESGSVNNTERVRQELLRLWEEHESKQKLVEVLTALQMCLEPVAESLVVADRVCFLRENGVSDVSVVRMMDSNLSPRCLAYVASKS